MSRNLYEAHRQWAVRPHDERFPDLSALFDYVNNRRTSRRNWRHWEGRHTSRLPRGDHVRPPRRSRHEVPEER